MTIVVLTLSLFYIFSLIGTKTETVLVCPVELTQTVNLTCRETSLLNVVSINYWRIKPNISCEITRQTCNTTEADQTGLSGEKYQCTGRLSGCLQTLQYIISTSEPGCQYYGSQVAAEITYNCIKGSSIHNMCSYVSQTVQFSENSSSIYLISPDYGRSSIHFYYCSCTVQSYDVISISSADVDMRMVNGTRGEIIIDNTTNTLDITDLNKTSELTDWTNFTITYRNHNLPNQNLWIQLQGVIGANLTINCRKKKKKTTSSSPSTTTFESTTGSTTYTTSLKTSYTTNYMYISTFNPQLQTSAGGQINDVTTNLPSSKRNKEGPAMHVILGAVLGSLVLFTIILIVALFFIRRVIQRKLLESEDGAHASFDNSAFVGVNASQNEYVDFQTVLSTIREDDTDIDSEVSDSEDLTSRESTEEFYAHHPYANSPNYFHEEVDSNHHINVSNNELTDVTREQNTDCLRNTSVVEENSHGEDFTSAQITPPNTETEESSKGDNRDLADQPAAFIFTPGISTSSNEYNENKTTKRREKGHKTRKSDTNSTSRTLQNNDTFHVRDVTSMHTGYLDSDSYTDCRRISVPEDSPENNGIETSDRHDNKTTGRRMSVNLLGEEMGTEDTSITNGTGNIGEHGHRKEVKVLSSSKDEHRRPSAELSIQYMAEIEGE